MSSREKQGRVAALKAAEQDADAKRLREALRMEGEADFKDRVAKRNSKQAAIQHRYFCTCTECSK